MHRRIPFFLALSLTVRRFQMPLDRVQFCQNVANIWNYLRNKPTSTKYQLRSFAYIDSLRLSIYPFTFRHALSLKRSRWPWDLLAFLTQVPHDVIAVKTKIKSIDGTIFAQKSLIMPIMSRRYLPVINIVQVTWSLVGCTSRLYVTEIKRQ